MPASTAKTPIYSPLLIFPACRTHKTTLVILHGRGSTAEKFAEPLLKHVVSSVTPTSPTNSPAESSESFRSHFPDTKFVSPTAPLRRAVVFKRSLTHQWFDNWSLTQPELKQHLQIQGLRETSAYLHDLLREEIKIVGSSNVVLMGLSQGCAASIIATLLLKGEPFGALVGMCDYLPFRKRMYDYAKEVKNGENDSLAGSEEEVNMFERDSGGDDSENQTKFEKALEWLREELEIGDDGIKNDETPPAQLIPVFMGHGSEDDKVPSGIGRPAAEFLTEIGLDVSWKEYDGLGHWYSQDMLRDIIHFLKELKGWTNSS